ncbi:MAG: rhodanese-like domain-containing protein [Pseudomonadota bacterium]|nr:rhodanese-like domain-containing protein [Pseudomonadota bacterium]
MKRSFAFKVVAGLAAIGAIGAFLFAQTSDLDRIHQGIAAKYTGIDHIPAEDFAALSGEDVIVFDVREAEEFAVSHLSGAIQVSPDISDTEFKERFAGQLKGRRAVFYCSVGVRSSILAQRVAALVENRTGMAPANLIGGIFNWSNDGRPMVSRQNSGTQSVHPYDDYWGRLIENRDAITYAPDAG